VEEPRVLVDDGSAPRFLRTTKAVPRWILEAMEMRERNVIIMLLSSLQYQEIVVIISRNLE
jgi:hypothetical protein